MTAPPAESPLAPPGPDPVAVAFGGLGVGLCLGLAGQAIVTWVVRTILLDSPPSPTPDPSSPAFLVLLGGTLAGIVIAGAATWTLLAPIRNPWRQGMLSMVSGLGSFALAVIVITLLPFYRAYGRPALLVIAAVALGLALLLGRRLALRLRGAP